MLSLHQAAAARALLDGTLTLRGLQRPTNPALYTPLLAEMATLGIVFEENLCAPHLWLRHEVKVGEARVILAPVQVAELLSKGFRITVRVLLAASHFFSVVLFQTTE